MNQDENASTTSPQVPAAAQAEVTGNIQYREKIILRPGTQVQVSLQQTSPADAPAKTLATQTIENPQAPPIPFVLTYDPTKIDERLSYAVRAKIIRNDRLLLTTDTHYPVLTRGAGSEVELMLVSPAKPVQKTPDAPLINTYWKLTGIQGDTYQHKTKNREPHIQFGKQQGSINGFTGCNNLVGTYSIDADTIEIATAVTQRACMDGMDTEQAMLQALKTVNRFEIAGDTLRLLEGENTVLKFEAVYLQ